jgi:hypothetical protein
MGENIRKEKFKIDKKFIYEQLPMIRHERESS